MKNGIKIMNLQGSNILKNNLEGLLINKEYKGVFADSLLLNKLKTIGLKTSKNETTRDIITVQFSYGYTPKSAKDNTEINELKDDIKVINDKIKRLSQEKREKGKRADKKPIQDEIDILKDLISKNEIYIRELEEGAKELCLNKESIRSLLYKDGFKLDFYKKDKVSGEMKIDETINYKFWFRTPSKSRVGDVMFINEKLYSKIKDWQRMGLKLPQGEAKIVEMAAYESLTSSHIEGTITIDPNSILVVDDINSFFTTNCAIVKTNDKGECIVKNDLYTVKNVCFDGQMLLDDSLFSSTNSMMLLRQHFFKACGFRTFIKKFMKDNFKDDYETATIIDRYGKTVKVKDILCITTENAMKWEKFQDIGASFDLWKQKVNEDGNVFGICKVDHPSKYGKYQRMSYQMINTLDVSATEIKELAQDTITYINDLKDNNDSYIDFLKRNSNEVNANGMMIDLYNQNKEFAKSEFFRDYKKKDLSKYVETLRNGKLLIEGDNLTIIGNPYTMLLHAVGKVPLVNGVIDKEFIDPTLPLANEGEDQYISVYTSRFNEGEYLAAFRNPHNSPNNIGYHKNFKHELMEKYFNFSENIMAVNMIQTEEQDLKNSEDMDSDFNFVTNNRVAVLGAKRVFRKYPCIVNEIEQSNKTYVNNVENLALIDNNLAKAKYDIGLSSNLAQLAMSWYWKDNTKELADIVCIMSVIAQCSIDNSKRLYRVDIAKEIKRISELDSMKHTTTNSKDNEIKAKPNFWKYVSSKVNTDSLINCDCPMNYLQDVLDNQIKVASKYKDTVYNIKFLETIPGKANDKQVTRVEEVLKKLDDAVKEHNDKVASGEILEDEDKWNEEQQVMQKDVVKYISGLKLKEKTVSILIAKALSKNGMNKKYKRKLLNALYRSHKELFLNCFKK